MGADPAFFGLLSIANLFPGWNSTVMSILGAARSVSWVRKRFIEIFIYFFPETRLMEW